MYPTKSNNPNENDEDDDRKGSVAPSASPPSSSSSKRRPLRTFPYKLHAMLMEVERQGLSHIIGWLPDGNSFRIHQPHEFLNGIAPHFFNLTKYKSFKRQLLNYGFERLPEASETECSTFRHVHFVKNDVSRCSLIERRIRDGSTTSTTTGGSSPALLAASKKSALSSSEDITQRQHDIHPTPTDYEDNSILQLLSGGLSTSATATSTSSQYPTAVAASAVANHDDEEDQHQFSNAPLDSSMFGGVAMAPTAPPHFSAAAFDWSPLPSVRPASPSSFPGSSRHHQQQQHGGSTVNVPRMRQWLASGAVSLPDLRQVLHELGENDDDGDGEADNSNRNRLQDYRDEILFVFGGRPQDNNNNNES